ncbi:acyltransferase [Pseudomonas sp. CGJS7]|uniref:acyltransferase n=1 Tax=Pseudomonas sp. CGJS7 TaxID=3109348 RepID=UPI00300A35A6
MIEKLFKSIFPAISIDKMVGEDTRALSLKKIPLSELAAKKILPELFDETCILYTTEKIFNDILQRKKNVEIKFLGKKTVSHCKLVILSDSAQIRIMFRQSHAKVFIGANCEGKFDIRLNNLKPEICVGEAVTSRGIHIAVHGNGISIGKQCLIGEDVVIQGHDAHGIVDIETMELINSDDSHTIVEPRVWLGKRVIVLPGNRISEGSIIGAASVVTKDIPACSLAVGIPAKVIKNGVTWSRSRYKVDEECKEFVRSL